MPQKRGVGDPTKPEVEEQLKRIAKSKTFENHPKLVELLEELVNVGLKNERVDEDAIGKKLFDKPEDWIPLMESAVRERKRLMKKELARYYLTEGHEDRVILEFPNYGTPKFYYNPQADAAERVEAAQKLMSETFPNLVDSYSCKVTALLKKCIKSHPSYAPAYALLAEALLVYTACDNWPLFPAHDSIIEAEQAVQKALSLDSRCMRAHLVAGALHCCRFEWSAARAAFKAAMRIDRAGTRRSVLYIAYLSALGKLDEAWQCLEMRGGRHGDRYYLPIAAILSYLGRDILASYAAIHQFTTSGDGIEGDEAYQCGERILTFDFWPAYLFAGILWLCKRNAELASKYIEKGVEENRVSAFYGLTVLAYSAYAKENKDFVDISRDHLERAQDMSAPMPFFKGEPRPVSAFSLALGYMGAGRPKEAVEKLAEACEEGFPLVVLLHRWPIFDELRDRDDFRKLIIRMNLPA